jgi:hypothetical protein
MPETVFYIVAEYPQVEHVAAQMKPAGVHEHGREEGQGISDGVSHKAGRHKSPFLDESVTAA